MRFLKLPFLCTALGLGLGLTACEDDAGIIEVEARMEIDPPVVDFGPVQVGTTQTIEVFVRNTGTANLNISGVSKGTPFDESFTFDIDRMVLVPNAIAVLTVNFSPEDLGERNGKLIVRSSNSEVDDQEIDIIGEGVTTTLEVDPESLSFGNVVVNTTKDQRVTLTNNSNVDANIEYVNGSNVKRCSSGLADPATFCTSLRDRQIGPDGRFSLRAGESTEMVVEFSPVIAGTRESGSFILRACAATACEIEVRLDGLGIEQGFQCDPPNLDFGQVNPGSCLTNTVSCTNIANEQVTVISWGPATQGGNSTSPDFEIEDPEVQILEEGDSFDVDVRYCPEDLGDDVGTLAIETDNIDARLRTIFVPLSGTGGGPDIQVLPDQLNFGLVSLIAPSRRTITIVNNGFAPLEVTEILADTDGTGAFSAPGASGGRLEPGEFLPVTVEFQPLAEGPIQSSLLIRSNDQDEPEVSVTLLGEGINLPPCSYEVVPAQLSFGVVERGRSVGRAFEIRNTGSNDCLITSARLEPGTDPEFSLPDGDIMSELVPPGAAKSIRVEYSPQAAGTNSGNVEFSISDPNNPFVIVPLSGTGADATLLIVPNDLDFGTIGVGCAARARTITIYNTGGSAAQLNDIQITGNSTAFWIDSLPAPLNMSPLDLPPGASTEFSIGFRADLQSDYAGAAEITGTFGGNPVTYIVSLQGRGDVDATQIDEFEQLGRPKVDILFIIDDSCSMSQEQTALGSNFSAFIQFAEAQALDYQISVATTDVSDANASGRFVGAANERIVNPQTQPSPEAVFTNNVNVGINGSAFEQGLQAAFLALSNPLIFGHNAGFLRQDAVLSLIFVSDEPDQSTGSVDFFINFFLSIKGFRNTNLFSASAIVGDVPGGCNGSGGSAQAGPRYVEAANRTGGIFQTICSNDWSRSLEDLSTTAFGFKSRFFLTNQPVISTIRVLIDDVEIPNISPGGTVNWSYDFATNSINFSPFATPEPGAQIRVEYTAECL